MTAFGRENILGRVLAGGFSILFFLTLQSASGLAAPLINSDAGAFDQSPNLSEPAFDAPPGPRESRDGEAIVAPLPQDDYLIPADPGVTHMLSSSSGIPKWRIPLISRRAYLSGDDGNSAPFPADSLPLGGKRPFDIEPLLRQSEEFMAIRFLLEGGVEGQTTKVDSGSTSSGWTDQPIRTDATGGNGNTGNTGHADDLGLNFFSTAVESLGVTDSQRQLVQKAALDLKKYIAIAQPNSQDIILKNGSDQSPVTIQFNNTSDPSQDNQTNAADPAYDDDTPAAIDPANQTTADYTRIFSFDNIWAFLTSSVMIVLYVLLFALWAAWRYAIRRFI